MPAVTHTAMLASDSNTDGVDSTEALLALPLMCLVLYCTTNDKHYITQTGQAQLILRSAVQFQMSDLHCKPQLGSVTVTHH